MDIDTLEKIKLLSSTALKGRKKLSKIHDNYIKSCASGSMTRAKTTTYNANTAMVMENDVSPAEYELKGILNHNNGQELER